jgi:hypothetical protein
MAYDVCNGMMFVMVTMKMCLNWFSSRILLVDYHRKYLKHS